LLDAAARRVVCASPSIAFIIVPVVRHNWIRPARCDHHQPARPGSGHGPGRDLAIAIERVGRGALSEIRSPPARRAPDRTWRTQTCRATRAENGLRGGAPVVAMVEAAEARQSHNLCSVSAPRHRPPRRCRLAEAQVRTVVVVVGDVLAEEPTKMPLVEDNDVVEELAAHAADPALGDGVLPRAAVGGPRRLDGEGPHRGDDLGGERRVAVEDEVTRSGVEWERLAELLDDPRRCGMLCAARGRWC